MNVERLRCLYKVIRERNENKKNTAKKKLPLNFASLSNDYKNNTIIIILQTPTAMNNTLFFHRIIIKK
jgi:hypothetical protein